MKISFYIILWIIIILAVHFIGGDSSLVVVVIAGCLCLGLCKYIMPKTLAFEKAAQKYGILEDVYSCNVSSFAKRLSIDTAIEIISAAYLTVAVLVFLIDALITSGSYWLALVLLVAAYYKIFNAIKFYKANSSLKSTPTPENCMDIADYAYNLDYTAYYNERIGKSLVDILPPRPQKYDAYLKFSLTIAIIAAALGALLIITGLVVFISGSSYMADMEGLSGLFMLILPGSFAAYYGVKDILSTLQGLKRKPVPNNLPDNTL